MTVHVPIWLAIVIVVAAYLFVAYCVIGFFGIVRHCQEEDIDTDEIMRRADSGRMFLDAILWPLTLIRTSPIWYDAPACAIIDYVFPQKATKPHRTPFSYRKAG